MNSDVDVIAGVGLGSGDAKRSLAGAAGLCSECQWIVPRSFHVGHMAFVSTILISNDAMWWVIKMFEGQRQHHLPGVGGRAVRAERDGTGGWSSICSSRSAS
jgi:hypothetical protein